MTAAVASRATTSATRSTRPPRRSPRVRTACSSSWQPAPARPTRRSRSSGASGRRGRKKRVLYLADRNVLIDQTMVNDFRPFKGGDGEAQHGIEDDRADDGSTQTIATALDKKRRIDTSYEIYLGLYQAHHRPRGAPEALPRVLARLLRPDRRRRVPSRQRRRRRRMARDPRVLLGGDADRHDGDAEGDEVRLQHPLLRPARLHLLAEAGHPGRLPRAVQGHQRPHRRRRRWLPATEQGKTDREGEEFPDRIYNQKDFDRTLVIDDRTKLVAKRVTEFLKESGDRFQKTIVFCVDQEHAARMRQALVNENADLSAENRRYVMRITGNDREGQDQLGNFIDPESKFPALVTTSRLLSTGVDAQTCRLIVLDRPVGSMTEFKQILGRGTRVHEDTHKYYFTLMDFRGATHHFADPDFDGEPVQIYEPDDDDPIVPPATMRRTVESGEDEIVVDPGNDISINVGRAATAGSSTSTACSSRSSPSGSSTSTPTAS